MTIAAYPFNVDAEEGDKVTGDVTGNLTGDLTGDVTGNVPFVDEYTALPWEEKEQMPMSSLMILEGPVQSFDWYEVIWTFEPRTHDIKYLWHVSLDKNC